MLDHCICCVTIICMYYVVYVNVCALCLCDLNFAWLILLPEILRPPPHLSINAYWIENWHFCWKDCRLPHNTSDKKIFDRVLSCIRVRKRVIFVNTTHIKQRKLRLTFIKSTIATIQCLPYLFHPQVGFSSCFLKQSELRFSRVRSSHTKKGPTVMCWAQALVVGLKKPVLLLYRSGLIGVPVLYR